MRSAFASSLQSRAESAVTQHPPSDSRSGFYGANATLEANRRLMNLGLQPAATVAAAPSNGHGVTPRIDAHRAPTASSWVNEDPPQLPTIGGHSSGMEDEDVLTGEELRALRVVELAWPVSVAYGEQSDAAAPAPLRQLADEATIKIYPRHVFLCRTTNGAPVAEIVIAELSELSEDEEKGTLSFYLKKSGGDGGLTIVEITCADPPSRSAIYKLICSRRSTIESES